MEKLNLSCLSHPRLTPRATSVPQSHSSAPTRFPQLCAFPPGANGCCGSAAQSPPKLFMYVKVEPSSMVTELPVDPYFALFPDPPEPKELDAEAAEFFLPTVNARVTPTATAATTKTARENTIIRNLLASDFGSVDMPVASLAGEVA